MNAPPNERSPKWTCKKKPLENGRFRTQNVNKIGQKNYCEIDKYVGKVFWAKNQLNWSFQSVAPSRMIYTRL